MIQVVLALVSFPDNCLAIPQILAANGVSWCGSTSAFSILAALASDSAGNNSSDDPPRANSSRHAG